MAKRRPKSGSADEQTLEGKSKSSVRIKPELLFKLRIIADAEGKSMGEWLEPHISGPITLAFKRVSVQLGELADRPEEPKA